MSTPSKTALPAAVALDPWLNLADVCAAVRFKKTAVYEMLKRGAFPAPVRVGPRCVRWRTSDVVRWMESHHAA